MNSESLVAQRFAFGTEGHDTVDLVGTPIVFIPGVMGSRLSLPGGIDWDPDSALTMIQYATASLDTKERNLSLVFQPFVDVFTQFNSAARSDIGKSPVLQSIAGILGKSAEILYTERGWPGPSWKFYGKILEFLEIVFNAPFPPFLVAPVNPVYAFAYDWRQSNAVSGQALSRFVDKVLSNHPGDKRVILVTHSMGGLVARAACRFVAGFIDKVRGVVHCVQPSNGAVTAYRRFLTGAVTPLDGSSSIVNFPDWIAEAALRSIIGKSADEYTLLMSGMAGPMELLPNHKYHLASQQWLKTNPQVDLAKIYDIYRGPPPGIVSPTLAQVRGNLFDPILLTSRITAAEVFHVTLDDGGHPNTFVILTTGFKTDEGVDDTNPSALVVSRSLTGDGTVHESSARCPTIRAGFVRDVTSIAGVEHAKVFDNAEIALRVEADILQIFASP